MNILRNLILGVVALGAFAIATPAQAHDHHRYYGHYYSHGPRFYGGVTYAAPYYYNSYDPYYYNDYYRPYPYYGYSYGPGVTFAFGGSRHYYYHHHHHHHH